jgi:predicted phosphodiesterase
MKILIFSDTHGIKHSILEKIFNFEHADFMIHAGDFCDQGDTTTHRFNTKKYKDNFKY